VDALQITLLGSLPKAIETNHAAYALYLQARYLMNQNIGKNNVRAEALLKQVIETDPDFAPAWTALANVYRLQATLYGTLPAEEGIELARDAIQQALDRDPDYGPAYAALADIESYYGWNFTAASRHIRRALELSPGDAVVLQAASTLNLFSGRFNEAIGQLELSIALSPLSFMRHHIGHYALGLVRLEQGDIPAAMAEMEIEKSDFFRLHGTILIQDALGNTEAADAKLELFIECCTQYGAYQIAQIYALRGEIDLAFEWLNKAYDNRDSATAFMRIDIYLANLHDDPRWEPFLDKMGLLL